MSLVGKKSIVSKATTNSLRAIIPENIVKELNIPVGDALNWDTVTGKGKKYDRIRRLE